MVSYDHFFSPWPRFEVFKKTPPGDLIEANCHARLNCLKQLLNIQILSSFGSVIKSYNTSYTEKLTEWPTAATKNIGAKPVFTQSDGDRRRVEIGPHQCDIPQSGSQGWRNLLPCDLLLSQQLLPVIRRVSSDFVLENSATTYTARYFQTIIFHKVV